MPPVKAYLAMWRETPHLAALLTVLGICWIVAGLLLVAGIYDSFSGKVTSP